MNTRKIHKSSDGKADPPMTRLKELPAEERAKVMEILRSKTYEEAAPLVSQLVGFSCSVDVCSKFYKWQTGQEALDGTNDMIEQFEEFVASQNKDWSPEKVRDTSINFFLAHTSANRDVDGFKSVAQLSLKADQAKRQEERLEFERAKFKESMRTKLETALDALAEHLKANPQAKAAYEAFRKAITETTK